MTPPFFLALLLSSFIFSFGLASSKKDKDIILFSDEDFGGQKSTGLEKSDGEGFFVFSDWVFVTKEQRSDDAILLEAANSAKGLFSYSVLFTRVIEVIQAYKLEMDDGVLRYNLTVVYGALTTFNLSVVYFEAEYNPNNSSSPFTYNTNNLFELTDLMPFYNASTINMTSIVDYLSNKLTLSTAIVNAVYYSNPSRFNTILIYCEFTDLILGNVEYWIAISPDGYLLPFYTTYLPFFIVTKPLKMSLYGDPEITASSCSEIKSYLMCYVDIKCNYGYFLSNGQCYTNAVVALQALALRARSA